MARVAAQSPSEIMHESENNESQANRLLAESAWVRRLAARLVRDPHLADDIHQDAMAAALRRSPGRASELRPWLGGVVRNLARMQWRARDRRVASEERAAKSERVSAAAEEALRKAELQRLVVGRVLELGEPYRSTVLLRFLEEKSVSEVAEEMNVPASTVRVRCKRGLELLEQKLIDDHDGDRAQCMAGLTILAMGHGISPLATAALSAKPLSKLVVMNSPILAAAAVLAVLAIPIGLWWADEGPAATPLSVDASHTESVREAVPQEPVASKTEQREELTKAEVTNTREETATREASAAIGDRFIRGRVKCGSDGVGGVTVLAFDSVLSLLRDGFETIEPLASVTTDSGGEFRLEDLEPFREYTLFVSADGYSSDSKKLRCGTYAKLDVYRCNKLYGRIVEAPNDQPIAGAQLVVNRDSWQDGVFRRKIAAVTNEDGYYELSGLKSGKPLGLEVRAPGRVPHHETVQLLNKPETRHDVTVDESVTVRGVVVDQVSGDPVPNAALFADKESQALVRCDSSGEFEIRIGSETFDILTGKKRPDIQDMMAFSSRWFGAHAKGYCWTTVSPGAVRNLENGGMMRIPLEPAASLVGVVKDELGQPIPGVSINYTMMGQYSDSFTMSGGRDSRRATTGEDGRFEFNEIPSKDVTFDELVVQKGGNMRTYRDVAPIAAGEVKELDLVLEDGVLLYGQVSTNGTYVTAYVYVEANDAAGSRYMETDPLGRYAFTALKPDKYVVKACSADATASWSEDVEINLMQPRLDPLNLEIKAEFDYIEGVVLEESGEPVIDQEVLAFRALGGGVPRGMGRAIIGMGSTNEEGRFRIPVTKGSEQMLDITVFWGSSSVIERDVQAGRDDIRLEVPKLVAVDLVLQRTDSDQPVGRVAIAWRRRGAGEFVRLYSGQEISTTSEGRVSAKLPVGLIDLRVGSKTDGLSEVVVENLTIAETTEPALIQVEMSPSPEGPQPTGPSAMDGAGFGAGGGFGLVGFGGDVGEEAPDTLEPEED